MKRVLLLTACFLMMASLAAAEEPQPPIPVPMDGLDTLPLPVDINQLTPEPLPKNPPSAAPAEALKALDQAQTVNSKSAAATPTPGKTPVAQKAAVPTPTPELPKAAVSTAPSLATGEYFHVAKGAKWSYEYLKAGPGASKKTRVVECSDPQASNGALQASFQVTEDGQATQEKYSLSEDKVTRASADDIVFQLPSTAGPAKWTNGGKTCKASFGPAQVYKKTYPRCVIVTEKEGTSTVISYYAKGIGLVAIEVYGKGLKLDQTKSIALVSGPGGN